MTEIKSRAMIKYLLSQDNLTLDQFEALRVLIVDYEQDHFGASHAFNRLLRSKVAGDAARQGDPSILQIYKLALLFDAPYDFDAYLMYIEFERDPEDRFYLPRRRVLRPIVDGLQALEDGELDTLFVSQPARTGKTTLCIFYLTWLCGRRPEKTNLACAYSDKVTKMFYDGVAEIIDDPTYAYQDVFPESPIVDRNSKEEVLDFGRKKKYKTLTCRSIDGALNGTCDCNGLLYGDDLVSGIEEALSPTRMETLWNKVSNNLLPRAKHSAKILLVGTRWSVADPIGHLIRLYETEDSYKGLKYKVVNLPALDEHGKSNFDYEYDVGFTTEDFLRKKASMDSASWLAQFMGQPIERGGLLFAPDQLKYFNGSLPDGKPDRILAAVDVAWGGGDSLSMPVGYFYGKSCYIVDVVFSTGTKDITRPMVIAMLIRHRPNTTRFEANNGGHEYKDRVDEFLKGKGINLNLTSMQQSNRVSKETRIFIEAPDIIENYYFLDEKYQSDQYKAFMRELITFSQTKRNSHDDAPDSLAQLNTMARRSVSVEIIDRPW